MTIPTHAIVFDLDDTLYPEKDYTFSGYRAVAAAYAERLGATIDLYGRMQELYYTPDRGRVFDVLIDELQAPGGNELVAEMVDTFRTHRPDIALFPDAASALERLAGRVRLGIISDGFVAAQQAKIEALKLHHQFDAIILTDEWGRPFWKPHPRAFEEMARRLGTASAACVYVGDNPAKDFIAPRALGWRTVLVRRHDAVYRSAVAPPDGQPDLVVESLDVVEALGC